MNPSPINCKTRSHEHGSIDRTLTSSSFFRFERVLASWFLFRLVEQSLHCWLYFTPGISSHTSFSSSIRGVAEDLVLLMKCLFQSRHSVGASDFPEAEPTGISRSRSVPDLGIKISTSVSVDLGLKPSECRSNRSSLHNFPT